MKLLFLCFFLGALVWLIQQGQTPFSEPTAYLGLLLILPTLTARIAGISGLSAPVGALVAGVLVGSTGLVSGSALNTVEPFSELATVWTGLYLGTTLSPALVFDRRFFTAASAVVLVAVLTTCFLLLIAFPLTYALQMGLLASLAAPFFTHIVQPAQRDALSISLFTTGLGLLLLGLFQAIHTRALTELLHLQSLLELIFWGIGIELTFHCIRKVRTDPGRYILFAVLTFLLLIVSRSQQIPLLFLSLASGLALSFRCGQNRDPFRPLGGLSERLVPFILADFTARITPTGALQLGPYHWQILLIYAVAMTAGKTVGALMGSRLTGSPFRSWCPILPQGILACILLPQLLPPTEHFAHTALPPGQMQFGFLAVCGVGVSILLQPIQLLVRAIETRQPASRR